MTADPRGDRTADDDVLMRRHVGGDPDAFGELVRRHRDRLWAVALRTLGDPDDAADALQDGFINAYRRAKSYRGDAAVTTWLHRIVVNACIDRVRKAAARPSDPLPESNDRSMTFAGTGPDPADFVATRLDVEAALATLPSEQRAALVLVDMEGVPVAEVAEMLGCAVGTVKSRCARARAKLLPLLVPQQREGNRAAAPDVPSTSRPSRSTPPGGDPR
ncbi:MAG TPA: RNA polymerase sigma factor SigM [Jiangellaceae bacterium]